MQLTSGSTVQPPESPVDQQYFYNHPELERAVFKQDGVPHVVIDREGRRLTWIEFRSGNYTGTDFKFRSSKYDLAPGVFYRDIYLSLHYEFQLYAKDKYDPQCLPELSIAKMIRIAVVVLEALQCVEFSNVQALERLGSARLELFGYPNTLELLKSTCDSPKAVWRAERVLLQAVLEAITDAPEDDD